MNEIKKENDILVSTLLNPQLNANDLIQNGINSSNTGLLSPEEYKSTKFVQKQFSDENGNFNDELFNQYYLKAAQTYDELSSIKTYKNLEQYASYAADDLYAPVTSNRIVPTFSINKIQNPYEISRGVSSLFGEGERTKSNRELAQNNKIYDNSTGEWLDVTPEDMNIFRKLFGQSLVYATWDNDGEHYDEYLGRTVQHKKGEWKTDKNGKFYTETIGDKEAYGKQFVSASDILTREDSWLNNIDFFDSDDLHKSVGGTIFKTAAVIAPYLTPYGMVWGGITAAFALAQVLPTFSKMIGGIFGADEDSDFTKGASLLENYFSKYNDSFSDEAQGKIFSFEQIANLTGDIFGQLYQMNAIYSLSGLLRGTASKAELKAIQNFEKNFGQRVLRAIKKGEFTGDAKAFYKRMAELSPELKAINQANQKLGKSLSLGYMALTSSADVFSDALAGGYDRRTAGFAGLLAAAGQYGIMMNNAMGDWFLRTSTGYTEKVNRGLMKKAISPYYSQIKESLGKIGTATTEAEKEKIIQSIFKMPAKGFKSWINLIKDGSEDFWKRALIESTEEVTEEAVMDATKGIFDVFSWLGWTGQKGSFGGFENVFSKEGASRYLMNALGGFAGGALFEFQGKVLNPLITNKKLPPAVEANLVHEIMNGNTEALINAADELAKTDSDIFSGVVNVDGSEVSPSANNKTQTRGEAIASAVKTYIKTLDNIINGNQLAQTDEELFNKALVTEKIVSALEKNKIISLATDSRVTDLLIADFETLAESIVKTELELQQATRDNNEEQISNLNRTLSEQRKQVERFLNGEFAEEYMKKALAMTNSTIREGIENLDIYSYTKGKYNKSYRDFPASGAGTTQQTISEEYNQYIQSKGDAREYLNTMLTALDQAIQKFSPSFKNYANNKYGDVRKFVLDNLLSEYSIQQALQEGDFKEFIKRASESLTSRELPGITANDIFQIDDDTLTNEILGNSLDNYRPYFERIANLVNVPIENVYNLFKSAVASELQHIPVNTITTEMVNDALLRANAQYGNMLFQALKEQNVDPNIVLQEINAAEINTEDENAAAAFIINSAPRVTEDINLNLGAKLLSRYLDSQSNIDQEMINLYKKIIYPILKDDIQIVPRLANEVSPDIEVADDSLRLFDSKIQQGLDQNKSTNEILHDFLFNPEDGLIIKLRQSDKYYQDAERQEPDLSNIFEKYLQDNLFKHPLVDTYNKALRKNIQGNPIYDLLREIQFELSTDQDTTIFNILESEDNYLQGLMSPEDYIRQGVSMEKLKNALEVIKIAKAVVETMNTVPLSGETPYGYNALIKQYLDRNGKDSSNYELLDQDTSNLITRDLELLENKLEFLIALSDSNTISKRAIDNITKQNFSRVMTKALMEKAGSLSIKGLSVISEDVLSVLSNETLPADERLERAEHLIYDHLKPVLTKDNVKDIAHDLIYSGNFNIEEILKLQSNGLGNPALSDYDLLTYLVTILSVDTNEFLYNYRQLLSDQNYTKVPLFTQEYATKLAYSVNNDTLGLHNAVVDEIFNSSDSLLVSTKNLFFLNGITGVGKTSVCAKNIFNLVQSQYKRIAIAAPNSIQRDKLYNQLISDVTNDTKEKTTKYTKDELFRLFIQDDVYTQLKKELADNSTENKTLIKQKYLDGKYIWVLDIDNQKISKRVDINTLPEVIFIDEVTHFSSIELELLSKLAETFNIKVFTFGDTLQDGSPVADNIQHIDTVFRWQTPRLENSMRPAYVNKLQNINLLTSRLKRAEAAAQKYGIGTKLSNYLREEAESRPTIIKYYESDNQLTGDKLVTSITVEDIKRLKASANNDPIGIITKLDSDGKPSGELQNLLLSAGLQESDYRLYSSLSIDENAVQGSEANYFIIDDFSFNNDLYTDLIRFYTFITRSLNGSVAKISDFDLGRLGIINRQDSYTEIYQSPSAEQNEQQKRGRIDQISARIGNYVPSTPAVIQTAIPVVETNKQSAKVLEQLLHEQPKTNSIGLNIDVDGKNDFIKCYTFYNRLGVEYNSGTYYTRNDGSHADLSDIFENNIDLERQIVLGFVKFKNLLTLYPDVTSQEFRDGIKNTDILNFFRKAIPAISNLSDVDAANWLINNLEISQSDAIIGKRYNSLVDRAAFLPNYSGSQALNDGDIFLTIARGVKTKNGEFNQNITLAALPKLSNLQSWKSPRQDFIDVVKNLETTVQNSTGTVTIPLNKRAELVQRGRIVQAESGDKFTSLSSIIGTGATVRELGLISPMKNKDQYSFIKYLKDKYNIEQPWFVSDGNLTISGRYYAVVEFENSNNTKYKQLLILGTAEREFNDIIKDIKGTLAPTRKTVGKYLSEYSQTKLVLSALNKINAYQNKTALFKYFTILRDYLASRTKQENYYTQLNTLNNFIDNFKNNPEVITENDIRKMLQNSSMLGIYFVQQFLSTNGNEITMLDTKSNIYKKVNFNGETGFYNIYPSGDLNNNGTYSLELNSQDYNFLGLRGVYVQMPNIGITPADITNVEQREVQIDTAHNEQVIEKNQSFTEFIISKGYESVEDLDNADKAQSIVNIIPNGQISSYIDINNYKIVNLQPETEIGKQIQQILDKDTNEQIYCNRE